MYRPDRMLVLYYELGQGKPEQISAKILSATMENFNDKLWLCKIFITTKIKY